MKVILVTGTSSGIGRECVHHLAKAGCHVVATARNVKDIKDLKADNVDVLALDVTKEESMVAAVAATMKKHGRIDGLVNNAGFGAYLPQETIPMATVRQMFEVNIFGVTRLTQLVLPHMRAQKSGAIVNISSVAGHLTIPSLGTYCGTKHALRAITGALWGEVRPHGIRVSLVEPGVINTQFGSRARAENETIHNPTGPYADVERLVNRRVDTSRGVHPRVIARAVRHACMSKHSRFRYTAPWDARAGKIVSRIIPDALWQRLVLMVARMRSKSAD